MSTWLVGVDAGGTSVRAAAYNRDTGSLHEAQGDGANWTVHGPRLCRERIEAAVGAALPAGAKPAALCLCMAGYYPPDHEAAVEEWLRERWPASATRAVPDVLAAWAGALGGEPGIVLVAGTGSICYGRNGAGDEARAGGWGPLFGDQGSAYALGVECLRALANEVDGLGPPSTLSGRLMRRFPELGTDLRGWLRGVYRCNWDRVQVASLAADVLAAAEGGDSVANSLVLRAAAELLSLAGAVRRSLGIEVQPLALQGGLASFGVLRNALRDLMGLSRSGLRLVEPRFSPLDGSVLLAAELSAGRTAIAAVRDQLIAAGRTLAETGV